MAGPDQGGGNNTSTGSVTFNFVQAQSAIVVPVGTEGFRFEFFAGLNGGGALVYRHIEDGYQASVTVDGVPTSARSAVVTALDSDGFPVSEFTVNVNVPAGGNVDVSASTGTSVPVTLTGLTASPVSLSLGLNGVARVTLAAQFSNGDSVTLNAAQVAESAPTSADLTTATVDATGQVTAVFPGSTFVSFTFRGQTVAVPVTVSSGNNPTPPVLSLTVDPTAVTLPAGTTSEPLVFTARFEGNLERTVGRAQGVVYATSSPSVTVDLNDRIVVASGAAPGTATVTGTYGGQSASVAVTINSADLVSIAVQPASVSLPFGGFEQQLTVIGTFTDGLTAPISADALTFTENSPLFELSTEVEGRVVTSNGTGLSAGQGTVTVTHTEGLTAQAEISVGSVFITSLTVSPAPLTLAAGEFAEVTVTANLSDSSTVDVTDFDSLTAEADNAGVAVNGNRIVGVTPGQTSIVTYTIVDAGVGGDDATGSVTVQVEEIEIVSVRYFFAGNEVAGTVNAVNLPRGYVGVFEVEATFSNGAVRMLRSEEFTIAKNGGARNPDAIQLFNNDYELRQPDVRYTNGQPVDLRTGMQNATATNTVYQVVDDFLGTVRTPATNTPFTNSSTDRNFAVSNSFRAVAADWYLGRYDEAAAIANAPVAPNSSANIELSVIGYDEFDRTISVTITDPVTGPTIDSIAFANYPGDPNIPTGSPRELEVRVTFPLTSLENGSLPPIVGAQANFKLAEANVWFSTDSLPDTPGALPSYRQVLHHRVTELGFIGVTSDVPYNVGELEISAVPLGGAVSAPQLNEAPTFEIDSPTVVQPGTPSETNPDVYTAGSYSDDNLVFGTATGLTTAESPALIAARDPGPTLVAGVSASRATRAPGDTNSRSVVRFNNNGNFFRIVNPVYFTLVPAMATLPLEVGQSVTFATKVQFAAGEAEKDVSLDFPPTITLGENNQVVGLPSLADGSLTVSGIAVGAATVQVLDVAGDVVAAVGTRAGTASVTTTNINVTPAP